ncbi:acid ceramidase-like isoform X3 [Gordionus sp. m RMFG-2023]|uniref:acid ceramidase-like isoform X3 n=1 Tax=Gordionus sp. m RMFG-2023 TaxID=3053472 RepID=UPI0031FE1BD8
MRIAILIVFILGHGKAYAHNCAVKTYPENDDNLKMSEYIINLDSPAESRWDALVNGRKQELLHLFEVFSEIDNEYFKGYLMKFVDKYLNLLDKKIPSPYREEINGISREAGLNKGRVIAYNIFYEIFTFCTSILAVDNSSEQNLYHVRNLDFGLFLGWNSINKTWKISEALKPLTVALDYRRGNVTIYKAVSFVGYLGVLTAMKPGKFSLTVNERFTTDGGGFVGILLWLIGCREMNWLSFFTRDLMANALSFQEAREQLKLAPLIAPVYFIIGGLDKTQANVITRSRMQMVNDRNLSAWHNSSRAPNWYLLETNYDWWKKPFFVDDRRTPAINCLKYTKQTGTINFSTLYDVLSTQPVLNKLTVYSSLMNVKAGTIETYLRECPNPCPPW